MCACVYECCKIRGLIATLAHVCTDKQAHTHTHIPAWISERLRLSDQRDVHVRMHTHAQVPLATVQSCTLICSANSAAATLTCTLFQPSRRAWPQRESRKGWGGVVARGGLPHLPHIKCQQVQPSEPLLPLLNVVLLLLLQSHLKQAFTLVMGSSVNLHKGESFDLRRRSPGLNKYDSCWLRLSRFLKCLRAAE